MTMNRYWWAALAALALLLVWMLTGTVTQAEKEVLNAEPATEKGPLRVAFRPLTAQPLQRELTLQGTIAARRAVTLTARLDSYVEKISAQEGKLVEQGADILVLASEDLPARIDSAQAAIRAGEADVAAAKALQDRGLGTKTDQVRLQAALAARKAELASLENMMTQTRLRAPFGGTLDRIHVESGEPVRKGDPLYVLVDASSLVLEGEVPQQHVHLVRSGAPVVATTVDGRELHGKITLIASQADADTRTYRVEASVPNPDGERLAGATARLDIGVGEVMAHRLSPAFLSLDDSGELVVEHIDAENRVVRNQVERVGASTEAVWVTGLPDEIRLLTLGKGYAREGSTVDPVMEPGSEAEPDISGRDSVTVVN